MKNKFIKLKENIDINDYADINNLESICFDYDKVNLKLEMDFKLSNANRNSENLNHINEFMFYDVSQLIGYIGIGSFGGAALEVNGMVHTDFRRKGIFTKLFSLVKDEFIKRESSEMLLLSDNNSIDGIEFIKNVCSDLYKSCGFKENYTMDYYSLKK